jgi:hypothetical protein
MRQAGGGTARVCSRFPRPLHLAEAAKKDHIKVTVEGMKHEGKILVEKLTEAD